MPHEAHDGRVGMAAQTRTDRPPWRFFLRWGAAVGISVIIASLVLYGFT